MAETTGAELRVKHLEMIQGVVGRMSTYSASKKNYCLTLVTGVSGLSISLDRPLMGLLAVAPILLFAVLDAQYLRIERRYRWLFDQVRESDWGVAPTFSLSPDGAPNVGLHRLLFSWSVWSFYLPLAIVVLVVLVAVQVAK